MSLFVIFAENAHDAQEKRANARPAHIARLQALHNQNRLVLAGPHHNDDGNVTGSLIVADFPTIADAHAWVKNDPYRSSGVYAHITIRPFTQVLPA